jgi:hypothetical protein
VKLLRALLSIYQNNMLYMFVVSCLAMLCHVVSLAITNALEDSSSVEYDFASLGESRRFEGS